MTPFFYDTWGFISLCVASEPCHVMAVEADAWLEESGFFAVTSDMVIDETLTGLHGLVGAHATLSFLDDLEARVAGGELQLCTTSPERWSRAATIFRHLVRGVPRLSFTDCTSFALMAELDIRWAFTADRHFLRAGPRIRPLFIREADRLVFRPPLR